LADAIADWKAVFAANLCSSVVALASAAFLVETAAALALAKVALMLSLLDL
jgi:hypothetical protein